MGGIVRSLFGGSKSQNQSQSTSSASSSNRAWDLVSSGLGPVMQGGANVFNNLTNELGGGFNDYKDKAGFNFQLNRGQNDIIGKGAARGLLNSGSTAKALAKYETDLGSTMYNNWLDRLLGVSQVGINAANPIVGAGNIYNATSQSTASGSGTDSGRGILGSLFG